MIGNDKHEHLKSRLTSLTRDLILIPSTESRPAERQKSFEFLRHHLDSSPGVRLDTFNRNGHESLVVRPEGCDAPEILLCGHVDVIEHSESDCYHSKVENGRIIGPGSGDMKGQIAIMIELMRAIHRRGGGASVGLAVTSDEERGGADGVRFLLDEIGLRCGVAIIPDGGSLDKITTAEKGVVHARLVQYGREAHAARPWLGDNAIERLLPRLNRLIEHFAKYWPQDKIDPTVDHWFPTCSITMCESENTTVNRVPSGASAVIDIRFPPPHSVESMLAEVAHIIGADCALIPLMTAEPTDLAPDPLFCQATADETGNAVGLVRASGGSDGRFFREHGISVNLSRPLVGNLHAIDEWIDIDSMVTYYQICKHYIDQRLA
ncbi:M20 family metallopeptidase [Allorhodopirellula heiligendammensis]|uniref:Succinyl-diaminopimelate desuccinylase n=1 Tax=Allorhodopirellula heiligendammensis TaxID=2714739 RepID=A0A5C6C188_9BACT|nr:M20/M25/M40 family metallo-hydrolase [Allorhodopirellula heiligendammensis]TWU16609.1 Succinyl-diaminopimelate desuccinylase [Allorhodopirellula heiligendammensis]